MALYGDRTLTDKELQITKLVADGLKNSEIGPIVGRSEYGIKNALRVIFDKTGMFTRLELALWWVKQA